MKSTGTKRRAAGVVVFLIVMLAGIAARDCETGSVQEGLAQTPRSGNLLVNPQLENTTDGVPEGWSLDPALRERGMASVEDPSAGSTGKLLRLSPNRRNSQKEKPFAIGQIVPVNGYQGQKLRVQAAMRVEGGAVGFMLVFALDRNSKPVGQVIFEQIDSYPDVRRQDDYLQLDKRAQSVLFAAATNTTQGSAWFGDFFLGLPDGEPAAAAGLKSSRRAAARIRIDASHIVREVPAEMFGTNLEWVRNGNGVWDDDAAALRPGIVARTRDLAVKVIRYPGGVFADYYNWRDGVGPMKERPERPHVADSESSVAKFGTHEFIDFCRQTGAEPLMQVNVVTGTADEAADWVAYCNRASHPERARNGSPEPFNVKLWEIGNEQYMKADFLPNVSKSSFTVDQYIRRFREFVPAMKAADPSIRILVPGGKNFGRYALVADDTWNEKVLSELAADIDYLAVHNAYGPLVGVDDKTAFHDVYRALLAFPQHIAENLATQSAQIRELAPSHADRIKLAVTEWGPLFQMVPNSAWLDHPKTLGSAMFVASVMNVFLRDPSVGLTTSFKLTEKDYGFMGWVGPNDVPKPSYYALQMYAQHLGPGSRVVETTVDSPTFNSRAVGVITALQDIPYLDVVGGLTGDGSTLSLMVVNKHVEDTVTADIETSGFQPEGDARVVVLTAASLDANNGRDLPFLFGVRQVTDPRDSMFGSGKADTVIPRETTINAVSGRFSHSFPPRSVTALIMRGGR